jgi:hypothetical protein
VKTFSHLWKYLAELFLEWEVFEITRVEEIKIHSLCSVTVFRKSYRLWDNVEKCGGAREATNDKSPRAQAPAHTHARTYTRAHTHTHTCFFFFCSGGYANTPYCYVIRLLPVLFYSQLISVRVLCYQPYCHSCFHLAVVCKSVATSILFQR